MSVYKRNSDTKFDTMDQMYSLENATISGGNPVPQCVDNFARAWVGGHYIISLAIIVILVLVVVWLLFFKAKESFSPGSTMKFQIRDGTGERLDNPASVTISADRSQSVFAQQGQDASGVILTGTGAPGDQNTPGTLAYQVLHSADYGCANRVPVGNDAWSWMGSVAAENATGGPKNDSDFSKILSGR